MAKINVNLYKYKNNIRMSLIKKNTRQDKTTEHEKKGGKKLYVIKWTNKQYRICAFPIIY